MKINNVQRKSSLQLVVNDYIKSITPKKFEKVLIYYGYPVAIQSAWQPEKAISIYKNYDLIVFGDTYANPEHEVFESTVQIFSGLKYNYPSIKLVGYVPIGGELGANLSIQQIKTKIDEWASINADGIFLDEFGYDYQVTRERQNEIISYVKSKGKFVFVNSWNDDYIYSSLPITLDWIEDFEPNPNSLPPLLDENDYSLYENLFWNINPDTNILTAATPFRINQAYQYFNLIQDEYETTYYNKFKTKVISLDAIPDDVPLAQQQYMQTFSVFGAKTLNLTGLAFGDKNWGSTGYFYEWDLPDFNLAEIAAHATELKEKTINEIVIPYSYTSIINGYKIELVIDVDDGEDRVYDETKRYIKINEVKVSNGWETVFSFKEAVVNVRDYVAQIGTEITQTKEAVDLVLPSLQTSEAIVTQARTEVLAAKAEIDPIYNDIKGLVSGFQYEDIEW